MWLAILAFLGGVLTIISPCILPVLPFVFARADRPFLTGTLPLLTGMVLTFAAVASLAAVSGAWAVHLNIYGRVIALVLLTALGIALLSPRAAQWLSRPVVALGNRLTNAHNPNRGWLSSVALGAATGMLWAPCAGPILGLILAGAVINGPSTTTTLLLFSYALGAAASLAVAVLAGGRIFAAMKRSLGAGEWLRRGLGVAALSAVLAIAMGWDTGILTQLSSASTNRLEQSLMDALPASKAPAESGNTQAATTRPPRPQPKTEGEMPSLEGAVAWLNSEPLTSEGLRGKVVLIDFWTYSCINCLRALPYVRAWHQQYQEHGLVIIGVHTPEFAFERDARNVRNAIRRFEVPYPVAMDNRYAIWRAFNNRFWPAHYFIDAEGQIRGYHFGEGNYEQSERLIRELLTKAGATNLPPPISGVDDTGVQQAADFARVRSPETYLGYGRAAAFVSPGGFAEDASKDYTAPRRLQLNQWALAGSWTVGKENATLDSTGGQLVFRFQARDVHLVLGPGKDGQPVRFRVTIDGKAPGRDAGEDVAEDGSGVIDEQRLYQLIRQPGRIRERTFQIEFLDPGASAFAFTFG